MTKSTDKDVRDRFIQLIRDTEKTLLPCPHCGKKVTLSETEDGMGYDKEYAISIQCNTKGCHTRKDMGLVPCWISDIPFHKIMAKNCATVLKLSESWNKRA